MATMSVHVAATANFARGREKHSGKPFFFWSLTPRWSPLFRSSTVLLPNGDSNDENVLVHAPVPSRGVAENENERSHADLRTHRKLVDSENEEPLSEKR